MVNLIGAIIGGFVQVGDILFPLEAGCCGTFILDAELVFVGGGVDCRLFEKTSLIGGACADSSGILGRFSYYKMLLAKSNAEQTPRIRIIIF